MPSSTHSVSTKFNESPHQMLMLSLCIENTYMEARQVVLAIALSYPQCWILPKQSVRFLASRVDGFELSWHERVLEISYKDATITNFSNKSYAAGPDGQLVSYEIRLSERD